MISKTNESGLLVVLCWRWLPLDDDSPYFVEVATHDGHAFDARKGRRLIPSESLTDLGPGNCPLLYEGLYWIPLSRLAELGEASRVVDNDNED